MKVLVLGGSGFLGSHVADTLTNAGYEVYIYDLKESPYLNCKQTMILGNILNKEKLGESIRGMDYVFHFAGLADLDEAADKPIASVELNVLSTVNILEECRINGIKRFIYASSFHVHSDKGGFYRCSKQAAELYIEEFSNRYQLDYTILRYGSLYGPRADCHNGIYRYLHDALCNGEIHCRGTGNELREYIHVEDAARLTVKILEDKFKNNCIVLTGPYPMKVSDMLMMIDDIVEEPVKISYQGKHSDLHYNMTPYAFRPKYSYKMGDNCYKDFGEGLYECIEEIYYSLHKENDSEVKNDGE